MPPMRGQLTYVIHDEQTQVREGFLADTTGEKIGHELDRFS